MHLRRMLVGAGLVWLIAGPAACYPTPPAPPTSQSDPASVADAALRAAQAGRWAEAVAFVDTLALRQFRDNMIGLSTMMQAARPTIYARADSIPLQRAKAYAHFNAVMAAGGPVLELTGVESLDSLRLLSPAAFGTRLFTHMDSLAGGPSMPNLENALLVQRDAIVHDSVAEVTYSLLGRAPQTVKLVRRGRTWVLDGTFFPSFLQLLGGK